MALSFNLPWHEFIFEYMRSRGPGGQNVNRTNSACQLRWNIRQSSSVEENLKMRLLSKLANRITDEGELLIRSDEFRDQEQNRNRCIEKLIALIERASFEPKKRVKTKPSKSAKKKRLEGKKSLSEKKTLRRKISKEEY